MSRSAVSDTAPAYVLIGYPNVTRGPGFLSADGRVTGAGPRLPATVQNRHRGEAHVTQHPPEARGHHAVALIVGDHLGVRADAELAQIRRVINGVHLHLKRR